MSLGDRARHPLITRRAVLLGIAAGSAMLSLPQLACAEDGWGKLVDAAKKEGHVALYSTTWPSFFAASTSLPHPSSAQANCGNESMAEPAAMPSRTARRVIKGCRARSPNDIVLLRGLLTGRRPANGGFQLLL